MPDRNAAPFNKRLIRIMARATAYGMQLNFLPTTGKVVVRIGLFQSNVQRSCVIYYDIEWHLQHDTYALNE